MVVITPPGVLTDRQSSAVGLPDDSVVGIQGVSVSRITDALVADGIAAVFPGEYICDSLGGFVADTNSFIIGIPPVLINRLV